MPALSKELVGQKLKTFEFDVERGKIREFCQAIGETNPIYLDREAARKAGFEDTPAPPTFQTSFVFWGYGYDQFWADLKALGIDTDRLLHLKEEYTYLKPLFPGMRIKGAAEVVEVKTGKMDMMTLRSTYTDATSGELCIEATMAIIMRPEGK